MAFLTFHLIPPDSEPESLYQINTEGTAALNAFWGAFVDTGARHKAFASHVTPILVSGVHHLLTRATQASPPTAHALMVGARELARLLRDGIVQPSAMLAWRLEVIPTPTAVLHPQS